MDKLLDILKTMPEYTAALETLANGKSAAITGPLWEKGHEPLALRPEGPLALPERHRSSPGSPPAPRVTAGLWPVSLGTVASQVVQR